jgi:hypothetical protein
VELDPELPMFGQVCMPGVAAVEEELARTCAEVTAVDALAVAVLREAMPTTSPASPARTTPTKTNLIAMRLIIFSWLAISHLFGGQGWIYAVIPVNRAALGAPSEAPENTP